MKKIIFLLVLSLAFVSCEEMAPSDLGKNAIIPKPQNVASTGDYFFLKNNAKLCYSFENPVLYGSLYYMQGELLNSSTIKLKDVNYTNTLRKGGIHFILDEDLHANKEAYKIEINKKSIVIRCASEVAGFRAAQTFLQLIELRGSDVQQVDKGIFIPTGSIMDYPNYSYRGAMLDVARHFFGVEDVKDYIDLLLLYKINVLHIHLSDDQGWRIEIKSWPKLTEIGGSTEVGGGEGGFYTQEEYLEIVSYASRRGIMIIPEIDLPGHTNAALASYAELNCDGKARKLYTGTRVGFSTLCVREELTYKFIDDVIGEIAELTPGPYIHIGGDESHSTAHDDYVYFIDRAKKIVNSHGKQMMGWDEISHGAIGEGDVAQFWSSKENAVRALSKGAKVLMSPANYCYLDMKYDSSTVLGLTWAGYTDVEEAYSWNPLDLVEGVKKEQILGIESPLWGETIETLNDIEFLAFPRIVAHAEIAWSDSDSLEWKDFEKRLQIHGEYMEERGISFGGKLVNN